jgi:hypothetical protein
LIANKSYNSNLPVRERLYGTSEFPSPYSNRRTGESTKLIEMCQLTNLFMNQINSPRLAAKFNSDYFIKGISNNRKSFTIYHLLYLKWQINTY